MAWWGARKGVISRSGPDFSIDRLAQICGYVNGSNPENWFIFWNNSTPPALFYIYKIVISTANGDDFQFVPTQNLTGTLRETASPVIAQQATPPGQIFFNPFPTFDNADSVPFQIFVNDFTTINIDASFPLFVIPPNSGLSVCPTGGGDNFAANFWYLWQ